MDFKGELSKKAIEDALRNSGVRVSLFYTVSSTSDYARLLAEDGANEGSVVIAEKQTKGRGRTGKSFFSPDGTGLYLSLILRPNLMPCEGYKITVTAAAALIKTLSGMGLSPSVKWVNDIFVNFKKVAGILTEGKIENGAYKYVILGVGINLYPPRDGFPDDIKNTAGYLWKEEISGQKEKIVVFFLQNLFSLLNEPFSSVLNIYRENCLVLGKKITAEGRVLTALDITDTAGLICEEKNGEKIILDSGEISIKFM